MNLESIRKIWVLIGSVVFAINADWIPDVVKGVFSAEGTELVFAAIGAFIALWQFTKSRTGENKGVSAQSVAGAAYWFPFKPA